jgi:hypothetical protein
VSESCDKCIGRLQPTALIRISHTEFDLTTG